MERSDLFKLKSELVFQMIESMVGQGHFKKILQTLLQRSALNNFQISTQLFKYCVSFLSPISSKRKLGSRLVHFWATGLRPLPVRSFRSATPSTKSSIRSASKSSRLRLSSSSPTTEEWSRSRGTFRVASMPSIWRTRNSRRSTLHSHGLPSARNLKKKEKLEDGSLETLT